jgi:haloacetate dehalogenase
VLHSSSYLKGSPLEVWRAWCTNVSAAAVTSGHFLAEENPADTLAALIPFLAANQGAP